MKIFESKFTTILLIFCFSFILSCRLSRHVSKGKYLLKSNAVVVKGSKSVAAGIPAVIRQQPNFKSLGLKLKLAAWNRATTLNNKIEKRSALGKRTLLIYKRTIEKKRAEKNIKIALKNEKEIKKIERKNEKRIARARKKGLKTYKPKYAKLSDTLAPRRFFREYMRDKFGEKPVIYSDSLYGKSQKQVEIYMIKKGYYFSKVSSNAVFNEKKKQAICTYTVETGDPFVIDSVFFVSNESWFKDKYAFYMKKDLIPEIGGLVLDQDLLDGHRSKIAKAFRDDSFYGFTPNNISYQADTIPGTKRVKLQILHSPRIYVQKRDSLSLPDTAINIPHRLYKITDVYFHLLDTNMFKGSFSNFCKTNSLSLLDDRKRLATVDTLFVKGPIRKGKYQRQVTLKYNGAPFVKADLLDFQNLLEHDFYFREKYIDRTYSNLLNLGIFSNIEPVFIENVKNATMEIHYYLNPSERQVLGFEPKATSSNGFAGVSIGVNYTHKNLFGRAERLTIGFAGGLESQPVIIKTTESESDLKKSGRSFNTFEIGPSLKLELPWFYPVKIKKLEKRQKSRTIIQTGYNLQQRSDFTRGLFNLNLTWYFEVNKAQEFQVGLPGASAIRFVNIKKSDAFRDLINKSNDLFLRNSYSDQFIYSDLVVKYTYQNMRKDKPDRKIKFPIYFKANFDLAGNFLALTNLGQNKDSLGLKKTFGTNYAQFVRLDTEYKAYLPIYRKITLALRSQFGFGNPYGNSKTSLPFDFGFFGGGANDNRGFRARALGPGTYKGYLDSNLVGTQIGDLQVGLNAELRFSMTSMFKGAFFIDAGNIWTSKVDNNRKGSVFTNDFYKQLAIGGGLGLRLDLNFFIVRFDFGIPLRNPSYPGASQWIWNSRSTLNKEISDYNNKLGPSAKKVLIKNSFAPLFHFGIGLPF